MDPMPDLPEGSPIQYAIGQLESGSDSGAIHWQFFVYFTKKRRLAGVKSALVEWIGDHANTTHCERARGTMDQCVSYVTKDDTRLGMSFSYGNRPIVNKSGRELLAHFRKGNAIDPTDPVWDDVLLRFSKSRLEELSNTVLPRRRDPSISPVLQVHYGSPGTGKSRRVFSTFPEAYPKPSGKWWDYYTGQQSVILDDFDGCMLSFGDFKRIVDRYPTSVEIKGATIPLLATHFYVTTNVYPSHWWSRSVTGTDGRDAIWRRITDVFVYESSDVEPIRMDPAEFRAKYVFDLELQDPKGDRHK